MAVKKLLMLGDPMLYRPSIAVGPEEKELVAETVRDLHDTLDGLSKDAWRGKGDRRSADRGVQENRIHEHRDAVRLRQPGPRR